VIDDYHFIASMPATEQLVELLVKCSDVNLLITSRHRPAWVSRRDVLYGDVLELNQTELAMISSEATQVLQEERASLSAGLISLANGWPAVVGLAGVADVGSLAGGGDPPEALYEFFADEVYKGLESSVQVDLGTIAVAPVLDREIAAQLLEDRADSAIAAMLDAGILTDRGSTLEFHPLARTFVEQRMHPNAVEDRGGAVEICLRIYKARRDWDSAFELIERFGARSQLDDLMAEAIDPLLASGRLATVETWVAHATSEGEASPIVQVAAAELGARRGQLAIAEAMAHGAMRRAAAGTNLQFRALNVAGKIAHLASREADGIEYFSRAEAAALDESSRREARWGRLTAMTALERGEARELLHELAADVEVDDAQERVRLTGKRLSLALRFGERPDLVDGRRAEQLSTLVEDPSLRCAFRTVYSYALALAAFYDDALTIASELISDARQNHVDFGLTYGDAVNAIALAGRRRFVEAHHALDRSLKAARRCTDVVGEQNVYATRVRLLLQEGRAAEACALEPPDVSSALPGIRGEVTASRGLALACIGRDEEALQLAADASLATQSLEVVVLAAAIDAVAKVRARETTAFDAACTVLELAIQRGGLDFFTTCYRASPDVLHLLLARPQTSDLVVFALARAQDRALAARVGASPEVIFDRMSSLSPREREVHALLCEGMSDREIGRLLFITPGTAKRHALRILKKTGFKSRRALILDSARRRSVQAAPTATREGVRGVS
jgi:DNA-binding CsgD family transcriptional regulator